MLYYDVFETPLGWMGALASSKGLKRLYLSASPEQALEALGPEADKAAHHPARLSQVRQRLEAYLQSDTTSLNHIRLDLVDAPPFHRKAWEACQRIPPGETRSYAWLAEAAGSPGAFRAAGQAMAKNRLWLVIPCHRVIASDGGLHGYGGGLETKSKLLELERRAKARAPGGVPV